MKIALALALALAPITNAQPTTEPLTRFDMGIVADQPALPSGYFVGTATWYDASRGTRETWYTRAGITLYGAIGFDLRVYKQHYWMTSWDVRITSLITGRSVIVHVVDECSCYGVRSVRGDEPLIDLSPEVWHRLGVKLGIGVMPITLEVLP
jgi:rare lipoprotein A (peptidoglycan hydrolase)